jgi:hypothetical protein
MSFHVSEQPSASTVSALEKSPEIPALTIKTAMEAFLALTTMRPKSAEPKRLKEEYVLMTTIASTLLDATTENVPDISHSQMERKSSTNQEIFPFVLPEKKPPMEPALVKPTSELLLTNVTMSTIYANTLEMTILLQSTLTHALARKVQMETNTAPSEAERKLTKTT